MAQVIGLTGTAGVGKDTVADILVEEYGYTKIGFADALRSAACLIDPIVGYERLSRWRVHPVRFSQAVDLHGYDEAKVRFPEVRRFLQRLGTDFVRNKVEKDFWTNQALRRADELLRDGPVVFTDVRFTNEADDIVYLHGGVIVRVDRINAGLAGDDSKHESETAMFDYSPIHFVLDNNGDFEHLRAGVKTIIESLEDSSD